MSLRNSSERRSLAAKRKFRGAVIAMPSCASCASLGCPYRVSKQVEECEECYKHNRQYTRVMDFKKWDKALRKNNKLKEDILAAKEQFLTVKRKLYRLRKTR